MKILNMKISEEEISRIAQYTPFLTGKRPAITVEDI